MLCGECPNYNNDNDDSRDGSVMRGCMFALVPSLILWLGVILTITLMWREAWVSLPTMLQ